MVIYSKTAELFLVKLTSSQDRTLRVSYIPVTSCQTRREGMVEV